MALHQLLPEQEIELDRKYTIELLERIETLEGQMGIKEDELNQAYHHCDPNQCGFGEIGSRCRYEDRSG